MSGHRVVVPDDHAMLREGVARIFQESGRFGVVAPAASGTEAVEDVRSHMPDLVLLAVSEDGDPVFAASKGAQGYLMKGLGQA